MRISDFRDRPKIDKSEVDMEKIQREYQYVDQDTPGNDFDNHNKYLWQMVGESKYGRIMVSHPMKMWRGLTMGEFYGSGIVD